MFVHRFNQTVEQQVEYRRLDDLLTQTFGPHGIGEEAVRWGEENGADMAAIYDYAIRKAKAKLNAPVMDDVEYHEIIKAQDLMDNL